MCSKRAKIVEKGKDRKEGDGGITSRKKEDRITRQSTSAQDSDVVEEGAAVYILLVWGDLKTPHVYDR